MKKNKVVWVIGITGLLVFLMCWQPAGLAAPNPQLTPFPTPTPGPDGRIMYIVQPGDTLWRISAVSGIPLDDLRNLNNLGADDIITPGMELLLGLGGPVEATLEPVSTFEPTSGAPTPVPEVSTGSICVVLYNDINGDASRQETEGLIPGGVVSLTNRTGTISLTAESQTNGVAPCFNDLDEGEYNISVAIPEGYNPTTVMNYALTVSGGDENILNFGAQSNSDQLAQIPTSKKGEKSVILGIIGAGLILVGIILGIYSIRLRKVVGTGQTEEE